jgi:hypothetical protein
MASNDQPFIRNHRDLIVWQKAMVLRRRVHLIVGALPREARWEIGRQTERAASAIAPNIAEGHSRPSRQDYRQYLSIARGENGEQALSLVDEISRMLMTMIKKL